MFVYFALQKNRNQPQLFHAPFAVNAFSLCAAKSSRPCLKVMLNPR